MTPEQIALIAIPVVALTQMVKRSGYLPDRSGPVVVLLLSVIAVLLFGWSEGNLSRVNAFSIFTGLVMVMVSAAGVYGLSRPVDKTTQPGPPAPVDPPTND